LALEIVHVGDALVPLSMVLPPVVSV